MISTPPAGTQTWGEAADIEWTMFSASSFDAATRSSGQLKREYYQAWLVRWTPEAADRYHQALTPSWRGVLGMSHRKDIVDGGHMISPYVQLLIFTLY